MSDKKILFIVTNHATLGRTGKETGLHLFELTKPFEMFVRAGFDVEIASPHGGSAPIDPSSYDLDIAENKWFMDHGDFRKKLDHTMALREVNTSRYQGIYFPGGHGTMWDLPENPQIQSIVSSVYEAGGVIGAVCHGPAALVGLKLTDGEFLIKGKKFTCFSNSEEIKVDLDKVVPFLLEDKLIAQGGDFSAAALFQHHVMVDSRLVTGQNPASAAGVAEKMMGLIG